MAGTDFQGVDFSKTMMGDDPVGPLAKLLWEIRAIKQVAAGTPSMERLYMSWNAAATAWHIHEWMWKLCPADRRGALARMVDAGAETRGGFAAAVREKCPELMVCCQIATAGKHVTIDHERMDLRVEPWRDNETGGSGVWLYLGDHRQTDIGVYAIAFCWWLDLYVAAGYREAENLRDCV